MSFYVTAVPSGHVRNVMAEILPYMDKAAKVTNGRMTADDILAGLLTGQSTLWCAFNPDENNKIYGVVTTTLRNYARRRMLCVDFCAGERVNLWTDQMMELLFRFGKDQQCSGMEFTGRRGWEKVLAPYGLQVKYYLFEANFDE